MIEKIIIKNYKCFEELELYPNEAINIIVGNNEEGKSTILEAINLALTGQLNRRNINYELSPFLFNQNVSSRYINQVRNGKKYYPPKILIEVYLQENEQTVSLKGSINSLREDCCGVSLSIEFNEEFEDEYNEYLKDPSKIKNIPVEYFTVKWYSFAFKTITPRSIPVKCLLIDASDNKTWNGTDKYISHIIKDTLEVKERVALNLNFRSLKEEFAEIATISEINQELSNKKGEISEKELTISLDISQKNGWQSNLTAYLDDIPFEFIGKGEQNSIKLKLALETNAQGANIILIEEPENHLSYANMNKLIDEISKKCEGKQIFITTHSNFVLNKLGLEKVILINNQKHINLTSLKKETYNYFMKLPGYDTLRLLLSKKAILVEGPSDELIVQKAYLQEYNKIPIQDGIDVITVWGLSFKRFLEIAELLDKEVVVITDNDGDVEKNIKKKYKHYLEQDKSKIRICYDKNEKYETLESQILFSNGLDKLNKVLEVNKSSENAMINYMKNNKSDCAMKIFNSPEKITVPEYIRDAIKKK